MVIVPDRIGALVEKGEITARYYNPGDLFDEVHLVLVNDDHPDPADVQTTVGRAELTIHNLHDPRAALFVATLGWRPFLLRLWARRAVRLAADVRPQLIRCHAAQLNAFAAAEIHRALGIPFVVSLHINPSADLRPPVTGPRSLARRLVLSAREAHALIALRTADAVVCVYDFIVPYATRAGARRVEVLYNVVVPDEVPTKTDYALGSSPSLIVVGRQIPEKNPAPVLEAVAGIPGLQATLVGNGPLHDGLRQLASELDIQDRVTFRTSLPNQELIARLRDHDLLVSVNDYGGVSKVEMEAALVGLPVITNGHPDEELPEVLGINCVVVDGSAASYRTAIGELIDDEGRRADLGQRLRDSVAHLRADVTETHYARLYQDLLGG